MDYAPQVRMIEMHKVNIIDKCIELRTRSENARSMHGEVRKSLNEMQAMSNSLTEKSKYLERWIKFLKKSTKRLDARAHTLEKYLAVGAKNTTRLKH